MIFKNKKAVIEKYIFHDDIVLDIGFWGQGITWEDPNWPHRMIKDRAKEVYGVDLDFSSDLDPIHYKKMSAESFEFPIKFDKIVALDLIEHLPNPGLFLDQCKKHLKPGGRLIVTTPNCFSLFNMTMKLTREDPVCNRDHTCYFNPRTLKQLTGKMSMTFHRFDYLYTVISHEESLKKKILNSLYWILSKFTGKYCEDFVAVIS